MRRVPVLREHDVLEERRNTMDRLDHRIAIGNGQRAAGAEIILHVHDDEHVFLSNAHLELPAEKAAL
jgi:hypothetical protein